MALFLITLSWCYDDFRKVCCYALSRNLTMEHLTFKSRNLSLKYMISRQMLLSSIPVSLLPYFHNKGADQTVCERLRYGAIHKGRLQFLGGGGGTQLQTFANSRGEGSEEYRRLHFLRITRTNSYKKLKFFYHLCF